MCREHAAFQSSNVQRCLVELAAPSLLLAVSERFEGASEFLPFIHGRTGFFGWPGCGRWGRSDWLAFRNRTGRGGRLGSRDWPALSRWTRSRCRRRSSSRTRGRYGRRSHDRLALGGGPEHGGWMIGCGRWRCGWPGRRNRLRHQGRPGWSSCRRRGCGWTRWRNGSGRHRGTGRCNRLRRRDWLALCDGWRCSFRLRSCGCRAGIGNADVRLPVPLVDWNVDRNVDLLVRGLEGCLERLQQLLDGRIR